MKTNYDLTTLFASVAATLKKGYQLPKFEFRAPITWMADNDMGIGEDVTIERALFHWLESAKENAQREYGEGADFDEALKIMGDYGPELNMAFVEPKKTSEYFPEFTGLH